MAADENGGYTLADMCCDNQQANARRIVACVNACAGISDEALDSWMNPPEGGFGHPHGPWPAHIITLQRAAETFRQQRDELLDALKYHQEQTRPIQQTIDTIAKVSAGETTS
jgi:hypothetical protein